jgi:type I restriction enzyme S subunit
MSFPRYQKYKDSGVEWWGELPENWHLLPAKRSFHRKKELNWGMKCENRLSLTLGGVVPRDLDDLDGLQASEFETYQIFSADDLVFKLIDLQNIKTSRVGLVPEVGIMSPAYIRVQPDKSKVVPKFAYWFFTNLYNRCIFNELGGGVRQTISSEELLLLPFPALSLSDQTNIAAFLDQETAKIDELVAEQERLMALLKEKRQAVISYAVTKGLNPKAALKPSGIEWLGDVPQHWKVIALKRIAIVQTGMAKGKDHGSRKTITVPYLRVANVQDGYLDLETVATMEIPAEDLERYTLRPGDVLMNEGGDFDKLGRGHIWHGQIDPCITQNHVFAVRPRDVSSEWLNTITGSDFAQFYFMTRSKQSTNLASISSTNLMELPVVLPPVNEQEAILSFISNQTSSFDGLIAEAQHAIDLLQERRTALISAAVTGQIDVQLLAN